jgi:hypothetical protein
MCLVIFAKKVNKFWAGFDEEFAIVLLKYALKLVGD